MTRLLSLFVFVLGVVSAGCSGKSEPACGAYETMDFSDCDPESVATLDRAGTWNMQIVASTGDTMLGHFSLIRDSQTLDGAPIIFGDLEGSEFGLSTRYSAQLDGRDVLVRRTYAACRATSPQRFTGKVRICFDDTIQEEGTFTAARIVRNAGEGDGEGLTQLYTEDTTGDLTKVRSGTATDVVVHRPSAAPEKKYAYVVRLGVNGWVSIFDVTTPGATTFVREIRSEADTFYDATMKGDVLYVASSAQGVVFYDMANPAAPVRLGARPSPASPMLSVVWDASLPDRLFAVSPSPVGEVLIFDVADPRNPSLIGKFTAAGTDPAKFILPLSAQVSAGRLYVTYRGLGLVIANVDDAANPVELGRYNYEGQVSVSTTVGQISDRAIAFESSEGWGGHLRAIDVTDPANPLLLGEFANRAEVSSGTAELRGTKLYVAYHQDGVRVIDVTNPSAMKKVGYFNTWNGDLGRGNSPLEGVTGVNVDADGLVYATDTERGLFILQEP